MEKDRGKVNMDKKIILEIRDFSKSYGGSKKAVDNISLQINSGDICGFIGHNGAGKSTTIRAVVGVLDFSEGEILIDGNSVKKDPVKCKQITAYIPDNPDIYEDLTGIEYLNFISDVFGIKGEIRKERINKYSELFGISDSLSSLIRSYSHGMRQKIAIISALIHEPKLLVLDEPFVGLDSKATFTLKEIMREMCSKGSAVFFSTHVLDVAEKLCNRVVIIKERSVIDSIAYKEYKKLTGSVIYMLNGIMGEILVVAAGLAFLFVGYDNVLGYLMKEVPISPKIYRIAIPFIVNLFIGLGTTTICTQICS